MDEWDEEETEYNPMDPYDASVHGFNNGRPMKINIGALMALVQAHMQEPADGIRDEPPWSDIQTREEHSIQQRTIWTELRRKAAEDKSIPLQLFDPPEQYVQVVVREECSEMKGYYCTCCFSEFQCEYFEIRVQESEEGVTTDMLLQMVGEALYGKESDNGRWYVGSEDERPVLKAFSYIATTEGSLIGNIYAYVRGIRREAIDYNRTDNHRLVCLN